MKASFFIPLADAIRYGSFETFLFLFDKYKRENKKLSHIIVSTCAADLNMLQCSILNNDIRIFKFLVSKIFINQSELLTNSFHNFALSRCSENYRILAKSEDGVIEAIRHKSLPWEGWMWHPERETTFNYEDINRIKDLFNS